MVTAQDIEIARRRFVANMGTEHEARWRQALERLVEQARREGRR